MGQQTYPHTLNNAHIRHLASQLSSLLSYRSFLRFSSDYIVMLVVVGMSTLSTDFIRGANQFFINYAEIIVYHSSFSVSSVVRFPSSSLIGELVCLLLLFLMSFSVVSSKQQRCLLRQINWSSNRHWLFSSLLILYFFLG